MTARDGTRNIVRLTLALGVVGTLVTGCVDDTPTAISALRGTPSAVEALDESDVGYSTAMDSVNARLLASGRPYQVFSAEIFVVDGWAGKTTILFNNRTHLFFSLFVPRDPRRGGRADLHYLVDQSDGQALSITPTGSIVALTNAVTEPEIDAAMRFWATAPLCGSPVVIKVPDFGEDPDLADAVFLNDPQLFGTPSADITHAGWHGRELFDAFLPNGSSRIIGIAITFVFIDDNGNPTDIDNDGRADAALREIYYNRRAPWTPDLTNNNSYDIRTVAIHEAGHAFGLGHFGKIFIDNNGEIQVAPRAIMNAYYLSAMRDLLGTDNASFCIIWANAQ
jgi:hypothetical protein